MISIAWFVEKNSSGKSFDNSDLGFALLELGNAKPRDGRLR